MTKISHLNSAGEALRALDLGPVRLRYRPADHLITRDTWQFTIEASDYCGDVVGTGDTPEAALHDALRQALREAA